MQKQYDKKLQEMEQLVQQLKTQNCLLEGLMRESEAKQKLMEKKKALELSQSQQQQAEIMSELSRMQKDRKREDEFSKAFREEFEAHKTMKGKCAALQNQLDSYLDTLDVSVHVPYFQQHPYFFCPMHIFACLPPFAICRLHVKNQV